MIPHREADPTLVTGASGHVGPEHLRTRREVAELLRERVPKLIYVLRHLVTRLPVMVTPRRVRFDDAVRAAL